MAGGARYGVEVRAAAATDAAEIARLLGLALPDAAERLAALRTPGHAVLVATGWNALSGVAAVHWHATLAGQHPAARLSVLLVDPGDRRRGIGRLLLKAASQAARAAGCDQLELPVTPGQDAAAAFCAATGFVADAAWFTRALRRRAGDRQV